MKEQEKKIKVHEQLWEKELDNVSTSIAVKLGFSHVPWFTLTKIVLAIQTILTVFVLFFRTDFVNLTVCAGGIYMIFNTDRIQKWTFRVLVFGIFLSLIYDIIWFYLQDQSNDNADGGVERSVRNFSLIVSYFSFFFRVRIISTNIESIDNRSPCLLERLTRFQQDHQEADGSHRKQRQLRYRCVPRSWQNDNLQKGS